MSQIYYIYSPKPQSDPEFESSKPNNKEFARAHDSQLCILKYNNMYDNIFRYGEEFNLASFTTKIHIFYNILTYKP